jgi:ribosomal protein S11
MAKAKKEKKKNIAEGNVYIQATFKTPLSNDRPDNPFRFCQALGAKKSTLRRPVHGEPAARKAKELGLAEVHVFVRVRETRRPGHPRWAAASG